MNELPIVSIILPVYNVELYLAECLNSVLQQNYQNFELIAVNDGSTDCSLSILREFEDKFSNRLIVVEQQNMGLSAARNTGLDRAKGEFVYFLDSDDWILSHTLSSCVDTLIDNNSDLVVFNAKAFCDGMPEDILRKFGYTRNLPHDKYDKGHSLFSDSLVRGTYIVQSCCFMYRFQKNRDLRFIPGILHEDNYFTTVLFLYSSNIIVLTDRFFQRRIRQNSITTSSTTMKHAQGYYDSVDVLYAKLSNDSFHSKEITIYYNYMILEGVRTELSLSSMGISRKLSLIYKFRKIINLKVFIRILIPNIYKKLVLLVKKSK